MRIPDGTYSLIGCGAITAAVLVILAACALVLYGCAG